MGAHTAPRSVTVGRVAGRGALTAAAALALTGGTASLAFAGTSDCDHGWNRDDHDSEYKDGFRDGYRIGYHDGEKSDRDCDDDHGTWDRDRHHRDHGKWDHGKRDHKGWDGKSGQFGARYQDSVHKGDDVYTINNVTKTGLLAGIL